MLMLRSLAIGLMLTMLKGRIELLDAGTLLIRGSHLIVLVVRARAW